MDAATPRTLRTWVTYWAPPGGGKLGMIILATISLLLGLALGLQFKVFILVPAIGLGLAITAARGIVGEDGVWLLIGTIVLVATSLPAGLRVR